MASVNQSFDCFDSRIRENLGGIETQTGRFSGFRISGARFLLARELTSVPEFRRTMCL